MSYEEKEAEIFEWNRKPGTDFILLLLQGMAYVWNSITWPFLMTRHTLPAFVSGITTLELFWGDTFSRLYTKRSNQHPVSE